MIRNKIVFLIAVVLAASAGIVGGMAGERWSSLKTATATPTATTQPANRGTGRGGRLVGPPSSILSLTPDQKTQMDAIWDSARTEINKNFDQARDLDHQREAAIAKVMSDVQRAECDKINEEFRGKRTDLDKARQAIVTQANEKTNNILTDAQKKLYQAWMQNPRGRPGRPTTQRSTTAPAGVVGNR